MSNDVEYLMEMGWTKDFAEQALKATNYQGLQAALDWIIAHPPEEKEPAKASTTEGDLSADQQPPLTALVCQSYKCEDCGKQLKSEDEIQIHSARTGHVNFTESADTVKPLTEEEKKAQIKRIHEYLERKKIQRQEEERVRQIEDEKRRREQGKTLVSAKIKFQEDEMRRAAEQTKREKAEDKAYREKLRAEIARDREEKMARAAAAKAAASGTPLPPSPTPIPVAATTAPHSTSRPTECRLQIRTPSGPPVVATFKPSEPLSAVVLYISQHWAGAPPEGLDTREITLQTSFPTRKFGEEDLQQSLEHLGLCPSSVLMAQHKPLY